MTNTLTIQDRIIKDFREKFVCQPYSDKDKIVAKLVGDTIYYWLPETIEQFLIQSIKELEQETRKEVGEYVEKRRKEVNIFSKETGDMFVQDILKFITNKEKQK